MVKALQKLAGQHYWASVFAATILPAALAGFFEYIMSGGSSGLIPLWAGLVSGVLTAGVLLMLQRVSIPDRPFDVPIKPANERVFTNRSPAELVERIDGLTAVSSKPIIERYLGLWLRAGGKIFEVEERNQDIVAYLTNAGVAGNASPEFVLYFNKEPWGQKLRALDKGDELFAVGKIARISTYGISLEDCEVVDGQTHGNQS